jgi:hypothetical protein
MNRGMLAYYLRRLSGLKYTDITQRLRLWRFHRWHRRRLQAAKTDDVLSRFFPGGAGCFPTTLHRGRGASRGADRRARLAWGRRVLG